MPASIALKLLKPEIIASLVGWLLYYFEKYLDSYQSKDATKFIFLLSLLLTSKFQ